MFELAVLGVLACVLVGWLGVRLVPRWRGLREAFREVPSGHYGVYYVEDPTPLRSRGVACKEIGTNLYVVEFPVSGRLIYNGPDKREFLTAFDGAAFVATPVTRDPDKPWRLVGPVPALSNPNRGGWSW
ncbi:hypothetical protein WME90_01790 [Sorangium sp. So ce375]|uniref:hypothetical protein n=1 Tax=Sorangium sp. So ce375 TaxID=3133306 RepID=UPI003F5ADF7F